MFQLHSRALAVLHADIEGHALQQPVVFTGSAGSVLERQNAAGFRFYAHQTYDADGKKSERYLAGPIGDPTADNQAADLRARIQETKALVPSLRLLGREGFALADRKTFGAIAALHNQRVFAAGAVLVGSHAFGVLLNHMGIRATAYATEDIDIARHSALAFSCMPDVSLLEMLRGSGIDFVEVPALDHKRPSTSWKQRGRSTFRVDLLVPAADDAFAAIEVPELGAWATGIPWLGYLLEPSQSGTVLAPEGCCTVRVPVPERFAIHKLLVSRLRVGRDAKAHKDILQGCTLLAALASEHPGAITEAFAGLPTAARPLVLAALPAVERHLGQDSRVWDELPRTSS